MKKFISIALVLLSVLTLRTERAIADFIASYVDIECKPLHSLHIHSMEVASEDTPPSGKHIFALADMPGDKRDQECPITPSIKALISLRSDGQNGGSVTVTLNGADAEGFSTFYPEISYDLSVEKNSNGIDVTTYETKDNEKKKTGDIEYAWKDIPPLDAKEYLAKKMSNPHYKLMMSKNDALCKPITDVYNGMLPEQIKRYKEKGNAQTNFESFVPDIKQRFEKIGLTEPPTQKITDETVSLVDFFNEGKPRMVAYATLLGGGGRTESVEIKVLKKDAQCKEVRPNEFSTDVDPALIDFDLPEEKQMMTTGRVYLQSKHPYIIINHYAVLLKN